MKRWSDLFELRCLGPRLFRLLKWINWGFLKTMIMQHWVPNANTFFPHFPISGLNEFCFKKLVWFVLGGRRRGTNVLRNKYIGKLANKRQSVKIFKCHLDQRFLSCNTRHTQQLSGDLVKIQIWIQQVWGENQDSVSELRWGYQHWPPSQSHTSSLKGWE